MARIGSVSVQLVEEPTPGLRWVKSDDRPELILQQMWRCRDMGDWEWKLEWRDVLVASEGK